MTLQGASIERHYDRAGVLIREQSVMGGTKHGEDRAYRSGRLRLVRTFNFGLENGISAYFDHDGALLGGYAMTQGTGEEILLNTRDQIHQSITWRQGIQHGPMRSWEVDAAGALHLRMLRHYADGQPHGIARTWDAVGHVQDTRVYTFGRLTTLEEYERATHTFGPRVLKLLGWQPQDPFETCHHSPSWLTPTQILEHFQPHGPHAAP